MVKRIICFTMAAVLTAALFAGCGSSNSNTTAASSSSAKAPEETTAPAKEVTLTLWQPAATKQQVETDIENDFLAANPNIKFNIVEQADMSTSAIMSAIAAGNAPAIFDAGYPSVMSYILQNAVLPIDEYIANTPDFANFAKDQVDQFLVNGKHYAVPRDKYAMGFFYNKKLFKEAGITAPPTTWDEFYDVAKKLTNPAKQQYGFGLDGTQWASWHFENWVWGAGGDLTKQNPDGTVTLTFTDPAVITAANFYRKLKADKVIQQDANAQIDPLDKDFAMGKSGMIFGGLQMGKINWLVGSGMKLEDIGVFPFPKGPSGKAYAQIGGDAHFIPVTKDKDVADAAWKWIMFKFSRDSWDRTLKDRASKGSIGAEILPRTDLKVSDYGAPNPELQAAMDASNAIGKPEYYAKGAVGAVADDAIAKWFADPTQDVVKVMKAAEDAANAKEAADFNKAVLEAEK